MQLNHTDKSAATMNGSFGIGTIFRGMPRFRALALLFVFLAVGSAAATELHRGQIEAANNRVIEDATMAAIQRDATFRKLRADRDELKFLIEKTKDLLQPGARAPVLAEKERKLEKLNVELDAYVEKLRLKLMHDR